jgi:pyrimidine operon attenuation protein/uracil phosphoribosyltransferase
MEGMDQLDLFPRGKLRVTLLRLSHELIEQYGDFRDTVILALQPRGIYVGRRMRDILEALLPGQQIPYGELDVTFFRDDFRKRSTPLQANQTRIDFLVEGKHVLLIDDVLYTGRTIRAAMDAMLAYGRPLSVNLLVLVDRKHQRELPIEPSYSGIQVDTIETQRVLVKLRESGGDDQVLLVNEQG